MCHACIKKSCKPLQHWKRGEEEKRGKMEKHNRYRGLGSDLSLWLWNVTDFWCLSALVVKDATDPGITFSMKLNNVI